MVARLDPCNPDALRDLLADRLPAGQVGVLEDHVQDCESCRIALERLAGGDDWLSEVRDRLSDADDPVEELSLETPFRFLAPSETPNSLGRIGTYEIQGVLGRGGNGVVLKAYDPGLNRFVAVKVMAANLASSPAARKRFAREAQAAAAVVHDHVVAIHAVDEAGGLPFLVMEYVRGHSAQEELDRDCPFSLEKLLRIGQQASSGLAAAHASGLIHRDIKPANLLIEESSGQVKLTDFGLARAADDASLTLSGVIAGTPQYMAPEQAMGGPIDSRADLFSLGSTLYALATGEPPFRAETPFAVMRRVADDEPTPIIEKNPALPRWFGDIVVRLMAKDPLDRFDSASELEKVFTQGLAHLANPDEVPAPFTPARQRVHPRRRWLAGAALVVTAIGITLFYSLRPGGTFSGSGEIAPPEVPEIAGPVPDATDLIDRQFLARWEKQRKQLGPGHTPDWADIALSDLRTEAIRLEVETSGPATLTRLAIDEPFTRALEATSDRLRQLELELQQAERPLRKRKDYP